MVPSPPSPPPFSFFSSLPIPIFVRVPRKCKSKRERVGLLGPAMRCFFWFSYFVLCCDPQKYVHETITRFPRRRRFDKIVAWSSSHRTSKRSLGNGHSLSRKEPFRVSYGVDKLIPRFSYPRFSHSVSLFGILRLFCPSLPCPALPALPVLPRHCFLCLIRWRRSPKTQKQRPARLALSASPFPFGCRRWLCRKRERECSQRRLTRGYMGTPSKTSQSQVILNSRPFLLPPYGVPALFTHPLLASGFCGRSSLLGRTRVWVPEPKRPGKKQQGQTQQPNSPKSLRRRQRLRADATTTAPGDVRRIYDIRARQTRTPQKKAPVNGHHRLCKRTRQQETRSWRLWGRSEQKYLTGQEIKELGSCGFVSRHISRDYLGMLKHAHMRVAFRVLRS